MQDNEFTMLTNACADLVSLKRHEPFPLHLLRDMRPGGWVNVRDVCSRVGVVMNDVGPEVFATWLPDPAGQEGYAVVLFYDADSMWSTAAHYNRARLLAKDSPNGTAHSTISPVFTDEAAPSPE